MLHMTSRIFIDTSVAIYAWGRDHSLRDPSREVFRLAQGDPERYFINAEVLQELLHRYMSLRIWELAKPKYLDLIDVFRNWTEPVLASDAEVAGHLADIHPQLSARDLVHVAVMKRVGATAIVSADRGFDQVPDIQRLDPADVMKWRRLLD